MSSLSHVLETCLYVSDLNKAEPFYRETLGLPLVSKLEDHHLFFRCGNQMLLLFDPEATAIVQKSPDIAPPHGASGPGHVAFSVLEEDLETWRSHLTSHDVAIEKEIKWGDRGRSLYFRDPSGNSLEVTTPAIWGIGA